MLGYRIKHDLIKEYFFIIFKLSSSAGIMHKSNEGILVILTFQAYFYIFSRNKIE
jgi:hypothetical protein